jgi:PKD repeat protein
LTVTFDDSSTGPITNRFWSFGDGGTASFSVATNPTHTYSNPGSYSVTLVVSGTGGSSTNTVANLISVYAPFAWWQLNYFGSTNNADAASDVDLYGTGMSNTNKFLAGFNPTNAAAYLHIISVATSNVDVIVTYLGASGDTNYVPGVQSRTNVLEYTAGAGNGNYTSTNFTSTGQTNILGGGTGLGTVTNMTDPGGATNNPSRYYRVRVLP